MNDNPVPQENYREEKRRQRKTKSSAEAIVGSLIGMLAVLLIFTDGSPVPVLALVSVVALAAIATIVNSNFRVRLQSLLQTGEALKTLGSMVGALAIIGIFSGGNVVLLTAVIALAGLIFFLIVMSRPQSIQDPQPFIREIEEPAPQPASLPAQASGQVVTPIDVRELCRGLPAMQAGQVLRTVDQLEQTLAEAERQGNVKVAFDARQALHDYLPGTVEAWKAQAPQDQKLDELDQALAEVQAIAGTGDSAAQRRAWETQQRFLKSRAPGEVSLGKGE